MAESQSTMAQQRWLFANGGRSIWFLVACAAAMTPLFQHILANNEGLSIDGGEKASDNRYDGVAVRSIPRPSSVLPTPTVRSVWVTMEDRDATSAGRRPHGGAADLASEGESAYDAYVALADQPFVSGRISRMREALAR